MKNILVFGDSNADERVVPAQWIDVTSSVIVDRHPGLCARDAAWLLQADFAQDNTLYDAVILIIGTNDDPLDVSIHIDTLIQVCLAAGVSCVKVPMHKNIDTTDGVHYSEKGYSMIRTLCAEI